MHADIATYNDAQAAAERTICRLLAEQIDRGLPEAESKIWHAIPVWFLDGNPIVGYGKLNDCVRLLFWSGQSFATPGLTPEGKFKAAEARFADCQFLTVARRFALPGVVSAPKVVSRRRPNPPRSDGRAWRWAQSV